MRVQMCLGGYCKNVDLAQNTFHEDVFFYIYGYIL